MLNHIPLKGQRVTAEEKEAVASAYQDGLEKEDIARRVYGRASKRYVKRAQNIIHRHGLDSMPVNGLKPNQQNQPRPAAMCAQCLQALAELMRNGCGHA